MRWDEPFICEYYLENISNLYIYMYYGLGKIILTTSFLQSLFKVFPNLSQIFLGKGSYYTKEGRWVDRIDFSSLVEIEDYESSSDD